MKPTADAVDTLLPQTQCRQCGYRGSRPYAEAIVAGSAAINRCPPGGDEVIAELAALLGRPALPLDPACGSIKSPAVARIVETQCIGCTLCLEACPVDAIIGTRRILHVVISAECTGCALCLPPCPVDCIVIENTGRMRNREQQRREAAVWRERYLGHQRRYKQQPADQVETARIKHEVVASAIERARARLAAHRDQVPDGSSTG